jgi:hypothetical protein
MSNVMPLVRVTGTAHGVRTFDLPAKEPVFDQETGEMKYAGREATSYDEVGVAVRGRFGDNVTEGNTGTLSIVVGEGDPRPSGGEQLDWLVAPYVRWVPGGRRGGRSFPTVAYRFCGIYTEGAATTAPARPSTVAARGRAA